MVRRPRVALLIETSSVYGRRILRGVTRYLRSHRSWSIFVEQREFETVLPRWFESWRGDGVISRWSGPRVSEALRRADAAVVDLSRRHSPFGLPRINSDDRAIGRQAAEHLLERRFRSFAFSGFEGELWSTRRRDAFVEAASRAGYPARVFETPWRGRHPRPREDELARTGRWLESLPKPVGVMACNDLRGLHVLDACQRRGLKAPDEVAVIGVDDDALLCELCDPPLSSIIPNPEQIGYEAAALLDRLMAGGRADFEEMLIPPLGVTTRLSTDVLAIDDEQVVAAVRYIRAHACLGITVDDVLDHVALSRTTLERRFRKHLGRSPQAEIRAVRLGRAKQLLAETDHPMHRIAELVGFEHTEYFHFAFRRELGRTPGEYRQEARAAESRHTPGRGPPAGPVASGGRAGPASVQPPARLSSRLSGAAAYSRGSIE
jgi:LacI family transcriptional regulator